MDRFAAGHGLPSRTAFGRRSRKALRGLSWLLASLSWLPGVALAGALPDISWTRTFEPIQGAFNRNAPVRVRVSLKSGAGPAALTIAWRLQQGGTQIALGDTLVPTAHRGGETTLTLRLPSLAAGQYVVDLAADPANLIEEKDEMNNRTAFNLVVPNGSPVLFRCEGPEGSTWKIQRVELNTMTGDPYPDAYGTRADTTRSAENEIVVAGVEPGSYTGIIFGPSVNKMPIAVSYGAFEMPDPSREIPVVWQRMTPYLVGRPKVKGDKDSETLGGSYGAPLWDWNSRFLLEGTVRNPTDRSIDIQYLLRFVESGGVGSAAKDTLLSIGALATERLSLSGRIPKEAGTYLLQAEIWVPWPSGFEDLGEEMRVASHILPLGYIQVQR
jgi:hypothetical protein